MNNQIDADKNISDLNHPGKNVRLEAVKKLRCLIDEKFIPEPSPADSVNNHIHTFYSFSPYSPAKAVCAAYNAGLATAGIMDHDSISGADEFIAAGEILGLRTTIGLECRVSMADTPLAGRRINNPDQTTVVYMAVHGIPHTQIMEWNAYLDPYRKARNVRNNKMTNKISALLTGSGIRLDFTSDVLPLSMSHEGGAVTERHILFALGKKIEETAGRGKNTVELLEKKLNIIISESAREMLLDKDNVYYSWDLLGVLKGSFVQSFYVDATMECPDVREVIAMCVRTGSVSAYAYLGDVTDSVTGDKRAQQFEDSYIEELFSVISSLGFNAVTYMPSRNTHAQLMRVKELCKKHKLFEISGEDINSPRQKFICPALSRDEFRNLFDSTYALIGSERVATIDLKNALFSAETIARMPDLDKRIAYFAKAGNSGGR